MLKMRISAHCVIGFFLFATMAPAQALGDLADTTQGTKADRAAVNDENLITASQKQEIQGGGTAPVIFKVRGQGFAVKDIDGGTEVETDIWEVVDLDTRNAFNTTTKRYVAPESGYYYLNAVVDQANSTTTAFFRLRFNLDQNARYASTVDGDDVKTRVSGIYFLSQGTEVYTLLRNFTDGDDERIDGTFSWFEGHKIY